MLRELWMKEVCLKCTPVEIPSSEVTRIKRGMLYDVYIYVEMTGPPSRVERYSKPTGEVKFRREMVFKRGYYSEPYTCPNCGVCP